MINRRPIIRPADKDSFLGLFTGKQAKAKAQAEVDRIKAETEAALKLEQAKRDTLALQLAQAQAGFNPEKDTKEAAVKVEETKAATTNNLYFIIGFAVVALMVGLYFISKKH